MLLPSGSSNPIWYISKVACIRGKVEQVLCTDVVVDIVGGDCGDDASEGVGADGGSGMVTGGGDG